MNWLELKSEPDLAELISKSFESELGVAIFKHSTRCSISFLAKKRLELSWDFKEELPIFYIDIIENRELSNIISDKFNVQHESPQILIIKEGRCVYNKSHLAISTKDIKN